MLWFKIVEKTIKTKLIKIIPKKNYKDNKNILKNGTKNYKILVASFYW